MARDTGILGGRLYTHTGSHEARMGLSHAL
jgi:hypothetical protein